MIRRAESWLMRPLVADDLTRAATFFSLALVVTAVGGALVGEFRVGIRWGLGLGAGFAVFAYFFIRPTTPTEPGPDDEKAAADEPPAELPPDE
jgi:hypothetical protein